MRIGVRIVRGQVHEHADTPHPLGLLRPRHQRRAYSASRLVRSISTLAAVVKASN